MSKYFHGAYSLENRDGVPPHTHSATAKNIANKLAIARLVTDSEVPVRLMKIQGVEKETNLTGTCRTIRFRNADGHLVKGSVESKISGNSSVK